MTMPDGKRQATSMLDGIATAATDNATFNRAYIEAARRSGRLCPPGMQDLGQRCFGAARDMTERFQATAEALSSARSVRETLDMQAVHVSTAFEQSVTQSTDLQEVVLQLVQQASAPLLDHLTVSSTAAKARGFQS